MRIIFFKFQLAEQNALLRRIAEALERLSPVIPAAKSPGRKSDLSDLRIVDHAELTILEEIKQEFARMNNVMPDSEAFDKALKAYEDELRAGAGQAAVDELPWNRAGRR